MSDQDAKIEAIVPSEQRDRFYAAATLGLRALDQRERSPRRFGPDADARWKVFRGALNDADRLEIMFRDATPTWGAAFSASEVFGSFGLAPDEPFGPDWRPISGAVARRLLTSASSEVGVAELAAALEVSAKAFSVPKLTSSTRIAVAGGSALVALARAFLAGTGLSWSDQVLVVANTPAHRQLAGLLAVVLGATARTRLVHPGPDVRAIVSKAGFLQLDVGLVSDDADAESAEFARRAAGTT